MHPPALPFIDTINYPDESGRETNSTQILPPTTDDTEPSDLNIPIGLGISVCRIFILVTVFMVWSKCTKTRANRLQKDMDTISDFRVVEMRDIERISKNQNTAKTCSNTGAANVNVYTPSTQHHDLPINNLLNINPNLRSLEILLLMFEAKD